MDGSCAAGFLGSDIPPAPPARAAKDVGWADGAPPPPKTDPELAPKRDFCALGAPLPPPPKTDAEGCGCAGG